MVGVASNVVAVGLCQLHRLAATRLRLSLCGEAPLLCRFVCEACAYASPVSYALARINLKSGQCNLMLMCVERDNGEKSRQAKIHE